MEAAAVHAFEQDQMSAGIHDRAGDGNAGLAGQVDGRGHHLLGALMREALALGDIHAEASNCERCGEIALAHAITIKEE